jgi:hypothetical protein
MDAIYLACAKYNFIFVTVAFQAVITIPLLRGVGNSL